MLSALPGATRKAVGLPEPMLRVGSDSEALVLWRATWPLDYRVPRVRREDCGPSEEGGAVLDPFRVQAPGLAMSVFPEQPSPTCGRQKERTAVTSPWGSLLTAPLNPSKGFRKEAMKSFPLD